MATSPFPDPLQLWRDAIGRMEKDANALATDRLKSPEVMRSLQQASNLSLALQQAHEKMVEAYLRRASLPSRGQLDEVAQALARIEEKLDRLLPPSGDVPRPARTRRPAAAAPADAAPAASPAAPARTRGARAKAPARRTRKS